MTGLFVGLLLANQVHGLSHGPPASYDGHVETRAGDAKLSLLPGLPGITLHGDPLYARDDPWQSYLADEHACPGAERTDLALRQQANTMVCLVNYARKQRGLGLLSTVAYLNGSAVAKADRIIRCHHFGHGACGEDPAADARRAGYNGAWGENLYIAEGRYGAPRVALDGWLNSPGHRANLFRPEWRTQGIAVQKVDRFGDDRNLTLWVQQFGGS